jgi:hypothetical protein
MSLRSQQEWMIEYLIFFDLCKRYHRPDVEQVYIAIQAALSFHVKAYDDNIGSYDVGSILCKIRPPGYKGLDNGYNPGIGMSGLAFFNWIYDSDLTEEGRTDYHTYRVVRKHDKETVQVTLKTTCNPKDEYAAAE